MTTDAEVYARTTSNRLMIADVLDTLDDRQWDAETLCAGWTVRHLAAHFVQPMLVGFGRFVVTALRFRATPTGPWTTSPGASPANRARS